MSVGTVESLTAFGYTPVGSVEDITTFGYSIDDTPEPQLVLITGNTKKADGTVSTKAFVIRPSTDAIEYATFIQIRKEDIYVTPDSNGDWSVNLYDTETMLESNRFYQFIFSINHIENKLVARAIALNYNELEDYNA